jgi:methylated-DNA-[protein]-cysteine S-methyltransferase
VEQTRFTVAGWGVGELWTSAAAVLAHDFAFTGEIDVPLAASNGSFSAPDDVRARPPEGAESPPIGTVPATLQQLGHGSVSKSRPAAGASTVNADELVSRLTAFLAGADVRLEEVPLDLSWATPFQHAVAESLRAVPRGEVVSYGELAALAGYPGAHRAVGTFCALNRFAFLVPCHRVVAADGIGGYGSAGVEVKRRLLDLENVDL